MKTIFTPKYLLTLKKVQINRRLRKGVSFLYLYMYCVLKVAKQAKFKLPVFINKCRLTSTILPTKKSTLLKKNFRVTEWATRDQTSQRSDRRHNTTRSCRQILRQLSHVPEWLTNNDTFNVDKREQMLGKALYHSNRNTCIKKEKPIKLKFLNTFTHFLLIICS